MAAEKKNTDNEFIGVQRNNIETRAAVYLMLGNLFIALFHCLFNPRIHGPGIEMLLSLAGLNLAVNYYGLRCPSQEHP